MDRPLPPRAPDHAVHPGISASLTFFLAFSCGAIVANLYLAQPLIGLIAPALGLGHEAAGLVVTLTQLGYAAGLLLLVPLGDLFENRRLIVVTLTGTILGLALAATSPNAAIFLLASLVVGLSSVAAQMLVPLAAHLAPDALRGRVIGNVMSGLFVGILLARPMASFLADLFGWRMVLVVQAVVMVLTTILLARFLPVRTPPPGSGYGALIGSMLRLIATERLLQRRTLYQATMFASFSLFWTAVPLHLAEAPFGLGQSGIALFALCGGAGALVAPVAGRLADAGWGRASTLGAFAMVAVSFLIGWIGRASLPALGLAAILLDAGVQLSLIVGQRAIYDIHPEMRSRINGIHIALFFLGGAVGSALTGPVLARAGWSGICLVGLAFPLLAFAVFALLERRRLS